MSTADLVQAYESEARQITGLPATIVYLPDNPQVTSGLQAKMGDGNAPYVERSVGYIEGAPNYTVTRRIALHELGHLWHFNNRVKQDLFWTLRFGACVTAPKTWAEANKDAHPTPTTELWPVLPGETIAECFAVAIEGTGKERTLDYGCTADPAAMRTFFGWTAATSPLPQKATVLWHLSHHAANRPDGWSGAPDEARWVREDLTPLVVAICARNGIAVTVVDGDLLDHPQFHANYGAFCAPHYEADIHGEGGSFWGRAIDSLTPVGDDRLGNIFWRRYKTLVGKPPDRFGWSGPNVTNYYGFRLTSVDTPGILVEHGVGAPGAPDHDWLRQNTPAIAQVWGDALVEFLGVEDVVTDQEFVDFYDRLIKPGLDGTLNAMKAVETSTVVAVRAAGEILTKTNLP